jgi:hypothetical protein
MCLVVYVASDYPLPTQAWDEARPRFHVTAVVEPGHPVRRQFTKPWVYYAGSHDGCGCGFQHRADDDDEGDPAETTAVRDSRRRLAEFLSVALQHQPAVEVFACWDGDEGEPPWHRGRLRPSHLVRGRGFFRERELLVVSETDAEHGAAVDRGGG